MSARALDCTLVFHRDINKREGGAAQRLVFAEYQSKVATDLRVGDFDRNQVSRTDIVLHIGARDETYPDTRGGKSLQQFAGIEFHRDLWLDAPVVKYAF